MGIVKLFSKIEFSDEMMMMMEGEERQLSCSAVPGSWQPQRIRKNKNRK